MSIHFHRLRRGPLWWIGIAGVVFFFVALFLWWRNDPSPTYNGPFTSVAVTADQSIGSEAGMAQLRGSPAGEITAEQEKIAVEADEQLLKLDELSTELHQEWERNKVYEPTLTAAWKYQTGRQNELVAPRESWDYLETHKEDWDKARLTQVEVWRPLMMIELLSNPDALPALREIATALANSATYRKMLAEELQALGQEVSLDGEGIEDFLRALREVEPALRDKQKSSLLTVPPVIYDHLQESSRVFAVNRLMSYYREPLHARQDTLSKEITDLSNDVFRKLRRLPEGNDVRVRLATRLKEVLYPVKK